MYRGTVGHEMYAIYQVNLLGLSLAAERPREIEHNIHLPTMYTQQTRAEIVSSDCIGGSTVSASADNSAPSQKDPAFLNGDFHTKRRSLWSWFSKEAKFIPISAAYFFEK